MNVSFGHFSNDRFRISYGCHIAVHMAPCVRVLKVADDFDLQCIRN